MEPKSALGFQQRAGSNFLPQTEKVCDIFGPWHFTNTPEGFLYFLLHSSISVETATQKPLKISAENVPWGSYLFVAMF